MATQLKKKYDVVYTTKSGRGMIAKDIQAYTKAGAMEIVKKQMTKSTSFDKVQMAIGLNGTPRAEESLRKLKESLKNAKTPEQKRNIQDLIHRSEIGLKKPATKGLRTLCAESFNVVGLRKKDGTQKKGYVAKKGGKMVKVATKKKTTTKK